MSLFGGSGGVRRSISPSESESESESEAERSQTSPTRSTLSIEHHPTPHSAQAPTNALTSDLDDLLTDSESDVEELNEEQPTRPNRFKGRRGTWKGYTAADRQVTASLEQIQNTDLSAHLYNAHALKRRVRQPETEELRSWHNKEHWLKRGKELEYIDVSGEVQAELVPSKDWTAWPLPPVELPTWSRPSGPRAVTSQPSDWGIGSASTHDAGDEMREELLATFSRLAKERWNTRETVDDQDRRRDQAAQSRSRSRSKSAWSARSKRSASQADVVMKDDISPETDAAEAQDEDEEKFGYIVGKKRGRVPQPETDLKPSFLVNDEKALRILEPTINSVLSKLDDLVLAVRRTRLNHFGRDADSDKSSHGDFSSGEESTGPASRPSSRAQSRKTASRKPSTRPASCATSIQSGHEFDHARKKFTPVLRDRKHPLNSDSTSASESKSDILEISRTLRKRSRPASTTDEDSASTGRDESRRAGLMDWSEVLGLAAVQGWDERVISRTAQRCAALFGESMSFIPMHETATKSIVESVHYTPSTTLRPDGMTTGRSSPQKRPFFQAGTLRCPHVGCYGHEKDFATPYRVVEHCMRVHAYDPRTNDSDNEERTMGGVHIDGFLQPITAQHGWLGRGRSKAGGARKKQKLEQDGDFGW